MMTSLMPLVHLAMMQDPFLANMVLPWIHRISFLISGNIIATIMIFMITLLIESSVCELFVNRGKDLVSFGRIFFAVVMANLMTLTLGILFFTADPLYLANRLSPFLIIIFTFFVTVIIEGMIYHKFFNTYLPESNDSLKIAVIVNIASYIIYIALMPFGYLW